MLENHKKFPIYFMNSLWFYCRIDKFTINTLSAARIHYEIIPFFRKYTLNSLSISRMNYEFTISQANSLWTHYFSHGFPINSLSFSWKIYDFTIRFANSLWIHYQLLEIPMELFLFTKSLWIYNLFGKFIRNFCIYFANKQ